MLITLSRVALAAIALHAIPAAAQSIQLPSVPIGGALAARVTLTSLGGPAVSGVTVRLTVPANCGTFQGLAVIDVVTDSSGSFSFVFTPGTAPGNCVIEGRSGSVSGSATTNIYRASDLAITLNGQGGVVDTVAAGVQTHNLQFIVRAGGLPVYGIPVTVAPAVGTGGAAPTLTPLDTATNTVGAFSFRANFPGNPGIFDFVVHAGAASQMIRIQQQAATVAMQGQDATAEDDLAGVHGPTAVYLVGAPASCVLRRATRFETAAAALPAGVMDFPVGYISLLITGCPARSSLVVRVEYDELLPANGIVYTATSISPFWAPAFAAAVSSNRATFTLLDGGLYDASQATADIDVRVVGVARPGQHVDIAKPAVHDMWWGGTAENGWGMSMSQSADGNVFAAIYAYDDAGKPTWWVVPGVAWDYARGSFKSAVYSTYGTPWYAYDTRYTLTNNAGSAKVTLAGTANATLDFMINGVIGRKALQRQIFGPADSRTVPNVNGMWWGGSQQSGWGVSIVQQNATLFAVWYTYDETNKPTWFVMPGGAWTGATTYEGRIFKTRGSPWLGRNYDASQLVATDVGPYKLTFTGTNATLAYTIEGRTGTLALVRQSPF